jgi:fumarate hydratase class I
MPKTLTLPLTDEIVRDLHAGDPVLVSGVLVTARDAAHKWLVDTFISPNARPSVNDVEIYKILEPILQNGMLYHCGPVVSGLDTREYQFVAAGPTTSSREEPYESDVIRHFKLKGVVGKGGMGSQTLKACQEYQAVYLSAIGGAAALIAQCVLNVLGVYKVEFGVPEALWVIEVRDFPAVVTMDTHGNNLHEQVRRQSAVKMNELFTLNP